jgi:hypothetical protein
VFETFGRAARATRIRTATRGPSRPSGMRFFAGQVFNTFAFTISDRCPPPGSALVVSRTSGWRSCSGEGVQEVLADELQMKREAPAKLNRRVQFSPAACSGERNRSSLN